MSVLNPISVNRLTFVLALFFVAVFNVPFFTIVKQGLENQAHVDPLFVATIPIFLISALGILFSLFSFKYILKPFFIVLLLCSSGVFFAAFKYGVVFDTGMIENTFQTNSAEALTYVNWASILNLLLTGVLPAVLLYRTQIAYKPMGKELAYKALYIIANVLIIVVIAFFYMQNYLAFGRNNDEIKRYIVPTYFVGSAAKYINQHYLQKPLEYQKLGTDAKQVKPAGETKPRLMVLVVGETARAQNYQYYGYDRPTNVYTKEISPLIFSDVSSCGTATAVSLPCMFSRMSREDYDSRAAKAQDTAVDVLNHAGVKVQWFDNDSGCKGVCDRVENKLIALNADPKLCDGQFCQDQVLLDELKQALLQPNNGQDRLIVLHIIGSHGPTYYLRYPDQYRRFTPDCQRSDIQNCSREQLTNTYDNTILYTDYIVSQVVEQLKGRSIDYDTAMMYLSDHGESLGEKGMYLHGSPYAIAPSEQTRVPWMAWFSKQFKQQLGLNEDCLAKEAAAKSVSHDNLFDTLLGLFDVSSKVYRPELDLIALCRR
ncbi:phosphoethanolamine transferase [Shewanella algae]|uniref:phosphoethanolamine transferase n=1 Tax=Shewanella algae TaxID=38313 RepID=UPI001C818D04|nr:phosphoethanolamine--lipid A transferase [Shewanella algae]